MSSYKHELIQFANNLDVDIDSIDKEIHDKYDNLSSFINYHIFFSK